MGRSEVKKMIERLSYKDEGPQPPVPEIRGRRAGRALGRS
jgi:hypothetical protein